MNTNYQNKIIKKTSNFRPPAMYPVYPPYHEGHYIEEYFYNYFINNNIQTQRLYIPIFWTNINNNFSYNKGDRIKFEKYLLKLDRNEKYFTICQHEDLTDNNKINLNPDITSIRSLPEDTIIFCGSGKITDRYKSNNIICMPHVVSKMKNINFDKKRNIFCSFIGGNTHPVRQKIFDLFEGDDKFYIRLQNWRIDIEKYKEYEFKDITERSIFSLCPRGNGPTSYRILESFQLGAIPVYIYDNKWIPWESDINWEDICVFVHVDQVDALKTILLNISENRIGYMGEQIRKVYEKYFTMDKVCETIVQKLKDEEDLMEGSINEL